MNCIMIRVISVSRLQFHAEGLKLGSLKVQLLSEVESLVDVLQHKVERVLLGD